jgi:uncharacterized alkaline shock family protein YloU
MDMSGADAHDGAGARLDAELGCGRTVESLLEAAAEPGTILDAHQQQCPYCRAALRTLRRRWSVVTAEAAAEVPVPAGLVDRMVGRLRGALTEPSYLQVPSAHGSLRIARSVVEDIARQTVHEQGLRVVGCRTVPGRPELTVEVHVVLPYGEAAARRAEAARRAVIGAVAAYAGLDVSAVDVAVVDVQF